MEADDGCFQYALDLSLYEAKAAGEDLEEPNGHWAASVCFLEDELFDREMKEMGDSIRFIEEICVLWPLLGIDKFGLKQIFLKEVPDNMRFFNEDLNSTLAF